MKISRNEERRQRFLDDLMKYFNSRKRGNFHVTDLLHPLVTFWARTLPRPHGEKDVLFFVIGNSIHSIVEPYFARDPQSTEVVFRYKNKVFGTPDAIDYDNALVEIKGTRKKKIVKKPLPHYVEQLHAYCALSGNMKGKVVTLYLAPEHIVPDVTVDDVEFKEEELKDMRIRLEKNADLLKKALNGADPNTLPLCPTRMCVYCNWNDVCEGSARLEKVVMPVVAKTEESLLL